MKGIKFAFLAAGVVAGAFVRYMLAESPLILDMLPVILVINVAGSFILGMFSILAVLWNLDAKYSLFAAVGFCGSLTTMSSFALETSDMIENRQFRYVAINILANVGLSVGAIFGGRALAEALVKG